jgi:syntaxin 1B/2/3
VRECVTDLVRSHKHKKPLFFPLFKASSSQLDSLIDETNELTHKVRDGLQEMQNANAKASGSSEARIRNNMHNTLTVKFLDLVTSYQEAQRKYKDKHNDKVRRQIKIVNPDATEEQIQQAIESGSKDIFASQLVDKKYKVEAEEALKYVQSKHKEIQKLEASINELHQLFVDMAILVEAQGELINQIEKNVESATNYTRQGVKQLEQANKLQKKSRKKMCILLICLLIIAGAIIVPTLVTQLT